RGLARVLELGDATKLDVHPYKDTGAGPGPVRRGRHLGPVLTGGRGAFRPRRVPLRPSSGHRGTQVRDRIDRPSLPSPSPNGRPERRTRRSYAYGFAVAAVAGWFPSVTVTVRFAEPCTSVSWTWSPGCFWLIALATSVIPVIT